jgi:hypothetical protein
MTNPQSPEAEPTGESGIATPTRDVRALIGWLAVTEGVLYLTGRQTQQNSDPALIEQCEGARAAVAARAPGIDQSGLIADLPTTLLSHIEALRGDPMSSGVFAEGFEPKLVDLSRVCAAQPQIFVQDATRRVQGLTQDDMLGLAEVTLPLPTPVMLASSFDPIKNSWIVSSPNPNLRIAGQFNGPVGPGMIGFGFAVTISKSYLQVAGLGGRYFLRDGYHRAYGLIAAGITHVPALVKEFGSFEEVGLPAGLLPQAAYLGPRPPRLADYLLDDVSVSARVPITQKLLVVQGLELTTLT